MPSELVAVDELHAALTAVVGSFLRDMDDETAVLRDFVASLWVDAHVSSYMPGISSLTHKRLEAKLACEDRLSSMDLLMLIQLVFVVEILLTHFTIVRGF